MNQPEYKLCKRGHERSPENIYKNGACKKCSDIRNGMRQKHPRAKIEYCKNGHERTAENVSKNGTCKQCKRDWIRNNPTSVKEHRSRTYQNNREKILAKQAEDYRSDPSKRKEAARLYQKNNPGKVKEYRRRAFEKDPERIRKYKREWAKTHPEYRHRWDEANPQKRKKIWQKYYKSLRPGYVSRLMGLSKNEAPQELIEVKRLTIQLQRRIKCQTM